MTSILPTVDVEAPPRTRRYRSKVVVGVVLCVGIAIGVAGARAMDASQEAELAAKKAAAERALRAEEAAHHRRMAERYAQQVPLQPVAITDAPEEATVSANGEVLGVGPRVLLPEDMVGMVEIDVRHPHFVCSTMRVDVTPAVRRIPVNCEPLSTAVY